LRVRMLEEAFPLISIPIYSLLMASLTIHMSYCEKKAISPFNPP
jgi:hypothetical protein